MSVEFKLKDIVRPVLDGFLPRGSGDEKAIHITLDLRVYVYLDYDQLNDDLKKKCDEAEEDDGVYESITEDHISVYTSFLFVRPMNYTMVLRQQAVEDDIRKMDSRLEGAYEEVGNHDSCWDSSFSSLERLMRDQGDALVERMGQKLKPEFRDKLRGHFHSGIRDIKARAVKLEHTGERQWNVTFA